MALLSSSVFLSISTPPKASGVTLSTASTSFTSFSSNNLSLLPPLNCFQRTSVGNLKRGLRKSSIVRMAPEDEKATRRSPLDFPVEWERPKPARKRDVLPKFSPMKTPLPIPFPCDPPLEDDDGVEEEEEEQEQEEEEDPDEDEYN